MKNPKLIRLKDILYEMFIKNPMEDGNSYCPRYGNGGGMLEEDGFEDIDLKLNDIQKGTSYNSEEYFDKVLDIIVPKLESKGYEFLGQGRNRVAYISSSRKVVIKIPLNSSGEFDNLHEYRYIRHIEKDPVYKSYYGKNKLFQFKKPGISLLIMEYLSPIKYKDISDSEIKKWVSCIDCCQVGINKNGKIKAYDYGLN